MPITWLEGLSPVGAWSKRIKPIARWLSRGLFALGLFTPLALIVLDWQWPINNVPLLFTILFGFVGCAGAISTSIVLTEIQATEKRLEEDITNLEDATRRNLTGFAEIFARAVWLLDKADQEVWYVNFLFGFGRPHVNGSAVAEEFEPIARLLKLPTDNFEGAVQDFASILLDKIAKVPEFHALVLNPKVLESQFLTPLMEPTSQSRDGAHAEVQKRIRELRVDELGALIAAGAAAETRGKRGLKEDGFSVAMTDTLPIQVLLARIRSTDGGEQRWGCLVFLVGTENVGQTVPRGFYSELDHIAEVYKEFCQSLIRSAKPVPNIANYVAAYTIDEDIEQLTADRPQHVDAQ